MHSMGYPNSHFPQIIWLCSTLILLYISNNPIMTTSNLKLKPQHKTIHHDEDKFTLIAENVPK